MKSHLSAFLLFLLLLNQSLSGTAAVNIASIFRGGAKAVGWPVKEISIPKWWQHIKKLKKPIEDISKPEKLEALSEITEYFSNYGYTLSSPSLNDSYGQETIAAIKTFQKYFNLPVTGDLNNETIQLMSLPRCGVPDFNFNYNFTDNLSFPKSGHRWFPKGNNLTYGFRPASKIPLNMTKVFRDSFTRWANATGLNLTETTYDKADIKIGFYNFTYYGFEDEVYGSSLIQSTSGVKVGHVLLDVTLLWELPSQNKNLSWEDGMLDLESAAMHQIGHLLGLDHSNEKDSVMYPYVLPSQQRKVNLSKSDKDNIQQQYDNGNSSKYSNDGGRLGVSLVTTLSVAFAYVLLLY